MKIFNIICFEPKLNPNLILSCFIFLANHILHELDSIIVIPTIRGSVLDYGIQHGEAHVLVGSKASHKCQDKDVDSEFFSLLNTMLEKRSSDPLPLMLGVDREELNH